MSEDWVREQLRSIDIDVDIINQFIEKKIFNKRRFLRLTEKKLTHYLPKLSMDRDDILDLVEELKAGEPMLLRTVSDDSVRSSSSLKMGNVTRDDSLKEENEPVASNDKDDKIPEDKVLTAALDRADKYEDDPTVEYYDIFISYRRSRVGEARALKQVLKAKGMKVFLDIDREGGLGVGDFQTQLEKVLHKVPVVIVMMTKAPSGPDDTARGGMDRSAMSSMEHVSKYAHLGWTDFCRIEMAVALRMKKLVVPVYPGSEGSSYVGKELGKLNGIEDVQNLRNCNAFPIHDDMFEQSVGIIVDKIDKAIQSMRPVVPPLLPLASSLSSKVPASAKHALEEGCTVLQCKLFGFTAKECQLAGYKAGDLYPLCMEPKRFYDKKTEIVAHNQKCIKDIEGWKDVEVHIGYFFGCIQKPTTRYGSHFAIMSELCNSSAQEFLARNQDEEGSHPFGFGPDRLLKFDYTPKEIQMMNLTATRLRNMGYNARECKHLGFSANDCRLAGFSASELYALCVQPSSFVGTKVGTELICRNQEPEERAMNTGDQVGTFMSRLAGVEGHIHKISKVRDFWSNESRARSQKDGGFPPYGFGPDKILKFTSEK